MAKKKPAKRKAKKRPDDDLSLIRLGFTLSVVQVMVQNGVSHFDLAKRMKKPVGHIVHLLGGHGDLDCRVMSDICTHLGGTLRVSSTPITGL